MRIIEDPSRIGILCDTRIPVIVELEMQHTIHNIYSNLEAIRQTMNEFIDTDVYMKAFTDFLMKCYPDFTESDLYEWLEEEEDYSFHASLASNYAFDEYPIGR